MGTLNFIHNLNSPLPYQLIFTNPRDWDVLIFVWGGGHIILPYLVTVPSLWGLLFIKV